MLTCIPPPHPQPVTGNNVLKTNIVPGPVSLSHCIQGVPAHRERTQNMQAHELLVGHMRLHNSRGLHLNVVAGLGVFKNQPPGLIFGLFPDTVGSEFQRHWLHSSAHSDRKEILFMKILFRNWGGLARAYVCRMPSGEPKEAYIMRGQP